MMQDGAHDDHGHGLTDDLAQMRKLAGEAMGRRRTLRLLFSAGSAALITAAPASQRYTVTSVRASRTS